MSPVGAIFVPPLPKKGTNLLHPRPPIVERVFVRKVKVQHIVKSLWYCSPLLEGIVGRIVRRCPSPVTERKKQQGTTALNYPRPVSFLLAAAADDSLFVPMGKP